METEKFELMLDEAQANAALEKGMLYADTFVNKNYLINLDRYPLVELDSAEKSDEYIRLYQIERIVYDVDENANDKLISVYTLTRMQIIVTKTMILQTTANPNENKRKKNRLPKKKIKTQQNELRMKPKALMFITLTTILMMPQNRKTEILLRTAQNNKMNLQK